MPVTINFGLKHPPVYPIDSAPKDGTMMMLWVDYGGLSGSGNPLFDATYAWTIGFNNFENTGEDHWEFAGWSWNHDTFVPGAGEPIGWSPLPFDPDAWDVPPSLEMYTALE